MKKHYRHENDCLNCGAVLQGKFCHVCGQENLQVKENFGHMMNHAISDYFHFDHQFFHTLKPLFFKPGHLTNEYMAGRRVQYLHPVKMYIFISLVYFLVLFQQKGNIVRVDNPNMTTEQLNEAIKGINKNAMLPRQAKDEAIKQLYFDNGYVMINNHPEKDTSKKAKELMDNPRIVNPTTNDTTYVQYLANQSKLKPDKRDGWFERYYNRKAFAIIQQKLNMKDIIEEGIKHDFPKMMFVLLPLFALILLISFYRSKKYYVEHLIYAFHLHCFIFLFLAMLMALNFIIPHNWDTLSGWLAFAAGLIIVWYIYKSLRVVYHRSAWRTITKMIGMSLAYLSVFTICMIALLTIMVFTAV
jgi:hypothetical protein